MLSQYIVQKQGEGMKIHNMIKKIIAGVLIVLLSFNSFAAIVSDNDGSAFITKAELEAFKQ